MNQELLFWITISSYYYLHIVYSLLVDKWLFHEIQDTDLHLMYKYFSWVSKKNVHFLQYRSVETGVSYYFVWQPHTNLLWLNGVSPQEFIRDGTTERKTISKTW